ncbi:peptidylprolyl isomerase [Celerinatantimonas sp. YJH-8]|uniref:peptidylprolyl isomerase n=1 Tax=Celerinatantimonas sp. YJH-8 TaxID=3228714 RepID=UPI0038C9F8CF
MINRKLCTPVQVKTFRDTMKLIYRLRLLLIILLFSPLSWAKPVLVDQAIAIVNNDIITQTDYNRLLATVKKNAADSHNALPDEATIHHQLMQKLINDQLVVQQAERSGVEISDTQLEQTIDSIVQSSGKSRDDFLLGLRGDNLSYEQFRQQVKRQLIITQTMQSAVRRRVHIDKPTIDALVKRMDSETAKRIRYHIGHIMIKFDDQEPATQTQQKVEHIFTQLQQGADFQNLAMAQSQGPKALTGGDWGWMTLDQMPTIFAKQIHEQNKGVLIGPFRSDAGYHILKILDVQGLQKVETQEVKARHILIKTSIITSDAKAKSLLDKIRQDIISGKGTFADYAHQYSQDPGSAVQGGELGWADPSTYVPAFKKEVSELPLHQVSQPFHSQYGWHILEVEDRRTTNITSQAKQQKAFEVLYQRQFQEQSQNWLEQLKQQSYIHIVAPKS